MEMHITAAGGVVENEQGQILFMQRRGKWDLPKGKLDDEESLEECAVREVEEETGLQSIQLGELVCTTVHQYEERGNDITKDTYWYAMKVEGNQQLKPQTEEDITELKWVSEHELRPYLLNTYPNIIQVIEKYFDNHNQVN